MWPRWLRFLVAAWVAWDASNRKASILFWTFVVLLLGPFLVPVYMATRPLVKGELRKGGFTWNLLWNLEAVFSAIMAFAAFGALAQNMESTHQQDIAPVRRAEAKAGSIFGFFVILAGLGLYRVASGMVRTTLEHSRK